MHITSDNNFIIGFSKTRVGIHRVIRVPGNYLAPEGQGFQG